MPEYYSRGLSMGSISRGIYFFRLLFLTAILAFLFTIPACQASGDKQKEDDNVSDTTLSKASGLLTPEEIKSFIPGAPEGFVQKDAYLLTDSTTGNPISNVTVIFESGPDKQFILSIQDYIIAREFFTLSMQLWNDSLAFEKEGSYARPLDLQEGEKGWVAYDHKSLQGTLLIGVHDRFLVSVRSDGLEEFRKVQDWVTSGWMVSLP